MFVHAWGEDATDASERSIRSISDMKRISATACGQVAALETITRPPHFESRQPIAFYYGVLKGKVGKNSWTFSSGVTAETCCSSPVWPAQSKRRQLLVVA